MGERIIASSASKAALDQYGPVITGVPLGEQIATTWEDRFFDGWGNVVEVFDLDYPTMEAFQVKRLLRLIYISGLVTCSVVAVLSNHFYYDDGVVPNIVLLLLI